MLFLVFYFRAAAKSWIVYVFSSRSEKAFPFLLFLTAFSLSFRAEAIFRLAATSTGRG
jgi:hypothetical protein